MGGTKERMVGGVAAVVSGRLFTGLSHGLCHNVMSVIHVCLCLETLWNVSWPSPIHKLGAAEGIKPGIFQTHSDHQFQKSTPPPPKKKNIHGRQFTFTSVKYPLCAKTLQPFQGHVPTGTSMRTTFHQVDAGHSTINCCHS